VNAIMKYKFGFDSAHGSSESARLSCSVICHIITSWIWV
jgi:hypothetical protein